jgi:hypothetical protein
MEIHNQVRLWTLRNFFSIYIDRARDLAKEGRKDEARDWLRFFNNSGILGILSDGTSGVLTCQEEAHFKELLGKLNSECHPLDVPNYQTDLQAIRGHLEVISQHLGIQSQNKVQLVA